LLAEDVLPRLRGRFGREYRYVESTPSTQLLIPADASEGTLVVAGEQTEGRGRLGRRWIDEAGASLLFSLCLRPRLATAVWPGLTEVAGQAAADAIETLTGTRPEIKAPNDLLLAGRKVAGLLAEADGDRIVLGVGVNVSSAPHEGFAALGAGVDRAELLVELLAHLERAYDAWVGATATPASR
jgi:BirA family biotin operon repressor/biotin-[acetyl-CoA-carboxylase] ligase